MRSMRRTAGITLIEVLIAVTLLALLSVGMMLSMRIGIAALTRTDRKLMENRRIAGAQRILEQQLEGLFPITVPCGALGESRERFVFFSGQPNTLTMASSFSLQEASRGRPQVLQFFTIPDEDGSGVRLVVNEFPFTGMVGIAPMCVGVDPNGEDGARLARFIPPSAGPKSFVLADHLKWVRFVYLAAPKKPAEPGRWLPTWNVFGWPYGIQIQMQPLEPSPARLQPVTVTAPMYMNRNPGVQYEDR